MIMEALIKADWVQTRAAGFLGISERMLRYKMKKYAITRE
jgi:transcriptional regulator with GAF, ATPase, and Fis domain